MLWRKAPSDQTWNTSRSQICQCKPAAVSRLDILCFGFFLSSFLALRTGCLLGLALVLAALCRMEQAELHAHITQALDKLVSSLQDGGQGRMLQEVSSTTLGWVEGRIKAEGGKLRPAEPAEPSQSFPQPVHQDLNRNVALQ